jgi:hypothetical protein
MDFFKIKNVIMKRVLLLILPVFFLTTCSYKPVNNISTTEALVKYDQFLKDRSFIVFPELRENPIRWFDSIPEMKIKKAIDPEQFVMTALPGEFFVFQVGLWALNADAMNVQIKFTDLETKDGKIIPASRMTCFNTEGTDIKGGHFTREVNVPAGRIQAFWMGIDLDNIGVGNYKGSVTIMSGGKEQELPLLLKVKGEVVKNHGYNEGSHLSRLNWLNSTVGIDEEASKGYKPVIVENNRISITGRTVTLDESGLPASVVSFFDASNQSFIETGEPIIRNPFRFIIEKENGKIVRLIPGKLTFSNNTHARVNWKVINTSDEFDLECTGLMEFDGFIDYKLKLTAKTDSKIKDIRLEIPVTKEKAIYMMGLGHEGGYLTSDWKWKWDLSKNQDMLWIGAVNGGLRVKLKAENYVRPLVNVYYYDFGRLKLPPSWGNDFKGGVNVVQKVSDVVLKAYSGDRVVKQGDQLNFDFELLITPFRLIDRQNKYGERYYHGGGVNTSVKIADAKKAGANIINIHHAEDIYPFINYPYLDANVPELTKLVADAHKENLRMKFYYTTREITKNLPEFWALNSLNGEVIFPGPGNSSSTVINKKGPNEWLVKNLRENYIPAWYNLVKEGKFKGETDLSVITTPDSRLNNFYVAGLDWMVQNIEIDGVYIDDSALDRFTLQRARKIIDHYRPEGRMDLHSWNHFTKEAGFTNCLNLYMDLLPYFDLVWIGEGRNYDRAPDHWLIEVSGIPFGLPGQMLEGGGNPWRGMVYGITNRAGWVGNTPVEIWKFFDEYKIADKMMSGYWEKNTPVKCSNPDVKATIYKGDSDAIISVANWSEKDQICSLSIDWAKIALDPDRTDIFIPEVKDFQSGQKSVSLKMITIPGKKGYLIVLKKKTN